MLNAAVRFPRSSGRRSRQAAVAGLVIIAAWLHIAALGTLAARGPAPTPPRAAALQVRLAADAARDPGGPEPAVGEDPSAGPGASATARSGGHTPEPEPPEPLPDSRTEAATTHRSEPRRGVRTGPASVSRVEGTRPATAPGRATAGRSGLARVDDGGAAGPVAAARPREHAPDLVGDALRGREAGPAEPAGDAAIVGSGAPGGASDPVRDTGVGAPGAVDATAPVGARGDRGGAGLTGEAPIASSGASSVEGADPATVAGPADEGREPLPAVSPASEPVPVYATAMPPPARLRYALQRHGAAPGSAELRWEVADGRYVLHLETRTDAGPVRRQASVGGFDPAGVAPQRYTDARGSRAAQAANFQRTAGTLTLSGSSAAFALHPGSQDRISWLVQLAAIVAADPARAAPGAVTTLSVAGARGEPARWRFRSLGFEPPDAQAPGAGTLIGFAREREGRWDSRIEVWLDPARHHWPVRVRVADGPAAHAHELTLEHLDALPPDRRPPAPAR